MLNLNNTITSSQDDTLKEDIKKLFKEIEDDFTINNLNKIAEKIKYYKQLKVKLEARFKEKNLTPEKKKKFFGAINREIQVLEKLELILNSSEKDNTKLLKIRHLLKNDLSSEDIKNLIKIFKKLLDDKGVLIKNSKDRLTIEELKLLAKYATSLEKVLTKEFKDFEKASFLDLFNFANNSSGDKKNYENEGTLIGHSFKETKTIQFLFILLFGFLGLVALPESIILASIFFVATLLVTVAPIVIRFFKYGNYFGRDSDDIFTSTIAISSETEDVKIQVNPFHQDAITGSRGYIKFYSDLVNLIEKKANYHTNQENKEQNFNSFLERLDFDETIKNMPKSDSLKDKISAFGLKRRNDLDFLGDKIGNYLPT